MSLKAKFCSQCGHAVVRREVGGRSRAVCPACNTVFYLNPLPVAAAVVLNDRREILLVKRVNDPHQGQWCFPMGFAELGETIADAARRELQEETGVEARVLRLLDSDSYASDFYGDLLIVTFELTKTGGREQAGDDAEEVRYFPIGQHPPLAFPSNEKALRACAEAHLEAWEIQDSFLALQANEDRALLSDSLVALIQERAAEVVQLWLADVRSNPTTTSYQRLDPHELTARATATISKFGRWLKGDAAAEEIRASYWALAQERKAQRVEVHEVVSALALLKKQVWTFARSQGVWERPIDVYRGLELNRLVAIFFDKATYHTVRGFAGDDA